MSICVHPWLKNLNKISYYCRPTSCFLEKIFFKSTLLCRLSEAQAWGGGLHPQVPLRFTWGYSWCHLYEVGVALRSFWPSGRRLEVFLHAVRLFRLNSQKTIGQIANPHAILSRRTTTIHKNFRIFRVFSGYNNPKNKIFVPFRVFSWLKK